MASRSAQAACRLRSAVGRCRGFPCRTGRRNMKLLPLDTPELVFLAAEWLARKENYQWVGFGSLGTPALFKIHAQPDAQFVPVYSWGKDNQPSRIFCLDGGEP